MTTTTIKWRCQVPGCHFESFAYDQAGVKMGRRAHRRAAHDVADSFTLDTIPLPKAVVRQMGH